MIAQVLLSLVKGAFSCLESDNQEKIKNSHTTTNNKRDGHEVHRIDAYESARKETKKVNNVDAASYVAYFPDCDEVSKNNNNTFSSGEQKNSDDEKATEDYSNVLKAPLPHRPQLPSEIVHLSENDVMKKLINVDPSSYAAYFPECDEISSNVVITFPSDDEECTDDEESFRGNDSELESHPSHQTDSQYEEVEQSDLPQFPALQDLKPTIDFELALKAGPMPRLCTYCFRWEDQPDDKYEKKDMVSDKWFMFGNIVFFRKLKPFWAQCSACGFGMPKKVVRGRKIHRVKRFLCKISGKEYKGYEFKRFGYEWMGEKGRSEGLSAYM